MKTTLYSHIHSAYLAYLRYLNKGGKPVTLSSKKHDPAKSEGKVHASALGQCPLARANERLGVPMTNPLTEAEELSKLHLMRQGVMDAAPMQEAFIFGFGRARTYRGRIASTVRTGAVVETSIESDELHIRGRLDAWVRIEGEDHIIEVKRRDAPNGKGDPQPKVSDIWQVMVYGLITGVTSLNILIVNRYYFKLWSLRECEGGGCVLVDEKGDPWNSVVNTPQFLNHANLKAEIARHLKYLNGETRERPIRDMLNDEQSGGWFCFKWDGEKPKKYKSTYQGAEERTSFIVPRCPWWCFTPNPNERLEVREVEYNSGRYALVHPFND